MQLLLVPRTRWFCFRPGHTGAAGPQVTAQPSASVYLFVRDAFRDDAAKKVHELKWILYQMKAERCKVKCVSVGAPGGHLMVT